jgi:hypothetical protein
MEQTMSMPTLERPVENQLAPKREQISSSSLQDAITDAVRKADPICSAFGGVFVERFKPKSRQEANWEIKGVKFGKTDRVKANEVLATIVERMQHEFLLSNDES